MTRRSLRTAEFPTPHQVTHGLEAHKPACRRVRKAELLGRRDGICDCGADEELAVHEARQAWATVPGGAR